MPEITLTYFDYPGRAEAARLALTIGGHAFVDERLLYQEFLHRHPNLPYGSLPTLTVDGQVFAQSAAILRYCGKLSNLYPEDGLQAQRVDEVIDVILDLIHGLEQNSPTQPENQHDPIRLINFISEAVPKLLGGLENRVAKWGNQPYLVDNTLSIADLALYVCLVNLSAGAFEHVDMTVIQAFPRLMQSYNVVKQHPKVQSWNDDIARRAALVRQRQSTEEVA